MADFRKEGEEQANEAVKTRLVLDKIVEVENIKPEESKVAEKIEEMAKMYGKTKEELEKNEAFVDYVKGSLAQEAVIEFLVQNAKFEK